MKKNSKNGLEEILKGSVLAWINEERIRGEKGNEIEFDDHCFLFDIYKDKTPEQVMRKGAQVGMSTLAILKVLHSAIYQGINQIYTLPAVDDVRAFVPGKVNQIIEVNECIRRAIEPQSVDAVEQKQFGKSFIYFKGTFTEREAIILTSDRNIYDELDKSKMEVVRDYASRLGFSKIRQQWYFSTPTIPDFGIDRLWLQSDQKHWRFNCPYCKFRQHMEWDKNVDLDFKKYICQKCHRELTAETIKSGGWEARFPGEEVSGYWIPQMIATWRTAADLIKELENAEDEQYFYNFILGMPYLNPESKIPASLILKNLTSEKNDERDCAMGVDVGERENHVIIGNEKGIFGIAVIKDTEEKSRWRRLGELMTVYDVRIAVIDALPCKDEAIEFAREFPYRAYLHFHESKLKEMRMVKFMDEGKFTDKSKDFEEEIKVFSDINRVQDATIDDLRKGKIRFNFQAGDSRIAELIEHIQKMYSRTVSDQLGMEHREWASTSGKNHFWDSLCEWKIAFDRWIRDNK